MSATRSDPELRVRPMIHVADLGASITFYEQLGGEIIHGGRDTDWVLMQLGTVQIALVAHRGEAAVELTFGTSMPLEDLEQRLHRAGFPVDQTTTDRDFGEQLRVRTPDGLLIKITQQDPG
jgi:catechol 2,3-dioxygenase-like lactoylglutathione lyase family enzyme